MGESSGRIPRAERVDAGNVLKSAAEGRSRRPLAELPIFIFYFLVSAFLTWPLIIRFSSSVYGVPSDNLGGIWMYWWWRNAGQLGYGSTFCPLIGFPFGTQMDSLPAFDILSYLSERFLLLFMNEVVVFNLEIMASFILSGITMYYLVRYLTSDRRVAFFGGFAYLIIPYHAYHAMYMGGGIIAVQWIPLYVLLLVKFIREPSGKRAALLALGVLLVAGTSVHNGLFMAIFTAAFLTGRYMHVRLSLRADRKDGHVEGKPPVFNRRTLALSLIVFLVAITVLVVVPQIHAIASKPGSPANWPTSNMPNSVRYGGTIWLNSLVSLEYILPHSMNPFLGDFSYRVSPDTIGELGNSLYIGWVIIVLATLCFFLRPQRKRESGSDGRDSPGPGEEKGPNEEAGEFEPAGLDASALRNSLETRHIIWGFALAALVCFLMSIKPYFHIGSVQVPLPSKLFGLFTPLFRFYMRMGLVVVLCAIVLACFGLSALLSRLRRVRWTFVLVPVVVLLAVELIIVPPFQNYSFAKTPELFEKVSKLPEGSALAFYPIWEGGSFHSSELLNQQRATKKPMLNGAVNNSDGEALRRTVYNPFLEATPRVLRRFGIDYTVYFSRWFEVGDDLSFIPKGFELVGSYGGTESMGNGYLLKVVAPPADLVPVYMGDIAVPGIYDKTRTVRLLTRNGIVKILNFTGGDARADVRIPIDNPYSPQRVSILIEGEAVWNADMEKGQAIEVRLDDLVVPEEGLDINITAEGALQQLPVRYMLVVGTDLASIWLSDVEVTSRSVEAVR